MKRSAKTKLQKCSRCNSVRYCSRECQKTHWVIHKAVCKEIVERQQAIADAARLNDVFDEAVDYLRARDWRKFESLINENLDVLNHQSEEFGRTSLLHGCAEFGIPQSAKMLLDKQADVNIQTVKGATPLFITCHQGHKDIVKMLLDKQADVNIQTVKGATPLFITCHQGHKDIVKMLLDKQADINIQTVDRTTPLYAACHLGHKDIVKMLLDKQADINIQSVEGYTPLYIACQEGRKDIVKMLLDKQADFNIITVYGGTPLFIACQNGHDEISELLRQHGAM
jgi:ankyrin repeat protein